MYSYIYTLIYTDRDLNAIYAPLYASISLHGITSLGFEIDSMKCCNNGIEMLNMTLLLRRARVLVRQGLGFGMRSREGVCVGQGGGHSSPILPPVDRLLRQRHGEPWQHRGERVIGHMRHMAGWS